MSRESQQRQAVVQEAISWLLTPYHHKARVKFAGVDCAMFPAEVYAAAGVIPAIPPLEYSPQWHLHRSEELYLQWVLQYAHEIPGPPQPGDFTLYHFGRTLSHGAIVVAWPTIIHAVLGRAVEYGDGTQVTSNGHRPLKFAWFSAWGTP